MKYSPQITPSQDTGWGLIFRVNDLLKEIETLAINGEYDKWNFKLDRIWANLCYRNPVIVVKDTKGEIKEIKVSDEDMKEKEFLDYKISESKSLIKNAKKSAGENWQKNKEFIKNKNELYRRLLIKDIWVRKKMYIQKLYIKELKRSPAGAMFGRGE